MTLYAEVAIGATDVAAALYDRLRPRHAQIAFASPPFTGAVAHNLGLLCTALGRHDDAAAHFEEAQELHARLGAPYWIALTRVAWG